MPPYLRGTDAPFKAGAGAKGDDRHALAIAQRRQPADLLSALGPHHSVRGLAPASGPWAGSARPARPRKRPRAEDTVSEWTKSGHPKQVQGLEGRGEERPPASLPPPHRCMDSSRPCCSRTTAAVDTCGLPTTAFRASTKPLLSMPC